MKKRLCMKCMNFCDIKHKICPYCGMHLNSYAFKSYYITPGTILKERYIVGHGLYENKNITYIGYDIKYRNKVIIEECYREDLVVRQQGENKVVAFSKEDAALFEEILIQTGQIAKKLIQLKKECGVGYHLKCFTGNGTLYVVKEYLSGETLEKRIASLGKIPLNEALLIISKLISRVNAIHIAGKTFGCIHPRNILLQTDNQIRLLNMEQMENNAYKKPFVSEYTAPEQTRGDFYIGSWSDVYSVAAVLYKMLTGESIPDAAARDKGKIIRPFSEFGITLPRGIEIAMFHALKLNYLERTVSINTFSKQLFSESVSSVPPTIYVQNIYKQEDCLCMGCMRKYNMNQYKACPFCGYSADSFVQSAEYMKVGTTLGERYIIGKCIGRGGFGITYIGYDLHKNIRLAIKEYMPKDIAQREYNNMIATNPITGQIGIIQFDLGRQQVLEEARLLQNFLNIEDIVQVFNCLQMNNTVYIIMEYLEGETLKQKLKRVGSMEVEDAIPIILAILNGLKVVHEKGIIHRDIAPDNVFLLENGKIKLLDFGAARYASVSKQYSNQVVVKPGYTPLEQYQENGMVGPWTDVYASAVTLYQMITGIVPLESRYRLSYDNVKKPSEVGVVISEKLELAIMKGMSIHYQNRTPSAEKFKDELITGMKKQKFARRFIRSKKRSGKNIPETICLEPSLVMESFKYLPTNKMEYVSISLKAVKPLPQDVVTQTLMENSWDLKTQHYFNDKQLIFKFYYGSFFSGYVNYEIYAEQGSFRMRIPRNINGVFSDINFFVSKESVYSLIAIFKNINWKSRYNSKKMILDDDEWYIYVNYGIFVNSSGYGVFPDNFHQVKNAVLLVLNKISKSYG